MKKLIEKFFGVKVYAKHSEIKGRKSGGQRDYNNVDWKKDSSTAGVN